MGARFENILDTVGNTPAVRINNLAPEGINLYVKIGFQSYGFGEGSPGPWDHRGCGKER